jgi:hypothetical protein
MTECKRLRGGMTECKQLRMVGSEGGMTECQCKRLRCSGVSSCSELIGEGE